MYTLDFAKKNELSFLSQSDQIKLSGFFAPCSNHSSKPCREPKLNKKSLSGKIANIVNPLRARSVKLLILLIL